MYVYMLGESMRWERKGGGSSAFLDIEDNACKRCNEFGIFVYWKGTKKQAEGRYSAMRIIINEPLLISLFVVFAET